MDKNIWFAIGGMTLVTLLPRLLPILMLSGRKLPLSVERWLGLIAPAILGALLAPELLPAHGAGPLSLPSSAFLLAGIPAFLVAWKTKSLFSTVVVGVGIVACLRFIGG